MSRLAKWFCDFRELIFPMLNPLTPQQELERDQRLNADRLSIKQLDFSADAPTALEEARRVSDAEAERRTSADQKATTYLAVVAALVPLILTVATAIWDKKAGNAPTWMNMGLLAVAVVYVSWAGIWAFRVLEVSASNRLGTSDFKSAYSKRVPAAQIARTLLMCARLNHEPVNRKINGIKMAHAFLLRAFLAFALILLFNILWFFGDEMAKEVRGPGDPWMASAPSALQAATDVNALRDRIEKGNSATIELDRWCAEHRMAKLGAVRVDKISNTVAAAGPGLSKLFQVGPSEPLQLRHVRLRCGSHILSSARLWYVPSRLPVAINRTLKSTNVPFGRAVVSLKLIRRPIASATYWPSSSGSNGAQFPNILFSKRAILGAAGQPPMAYVVEDYHKGVLDYAPR